MRFAVFFCPTSCSNQESKGFFCRQATYKGKYGKAKEAAESARASLSPQEGDVRKSRKENRHKKGTWEGQEKEKKRKRPRKARRWLQRRQGSVCLTPRIPFFGSRVVGLEAAHLGWSISSYKTLSRSKPWSKELPETDYFTQQKQYLKRTTLRTYSAKAVP